MIITGSAEFIPLHKTGEPTVHAGMNSALPVGRFNSQRS